MASDERWYFTKEQLANSPSRRCGVDADKELSYRQQAANFIQDMGQRLVVSQLCINTAIVYMHRFYVFHSLTQFHRNAIAVAALFLAAKVEEQPRKLEHVIKMAYMCLHREQAPPDSRSEVSFSVKPKQFIEQAQDLVFNENVLLQTLGFDVAIDHPHTHVVRCCQLVKASKDLAQTSYFMASNSLHLTTMCLQYKPTVVACFCIHLACRWSNWEIPQSTEGREWFWYVDRTVTSKLLQELTEEFLHIFDKCPSRLKKKIMSISANQSPSSHPPSLSNSPFDAEPRKVSPATTTDGASTSGSSAAGSISTSSTCNLASSLSAAIAAYSNRSHHTQEKQDEKKSGAGAGSSTSRAAVDYREYREKKERERLEREKAAAIGCHVTDPSKSHHSHLHKTASNASVPSKHQVPVQKGSSLHHNHYHRLDMKIGQPVPQRHSASSQSREPSRDPNRQRLSREHNATSIAHSSHSHGNLDNSSESASHRTNGGATQDSASSLHSNLQEKMSNNNYSGHRLNALDKHQTHDKRMYRVEDPRLKSAKYPDISKIENQRRKAETLEQRSEEVRKLIEKPLPPPKQADVPYLMNAQPKQQAHHSKYNQQDKSQSSSLAIDAKHPAATGQNALLQDKSPNALVSSASSSQIPQKSQAPKTQLYNQHTAQGVSQILKDTIKNGNSQSCLSLNNMDDPKRSRTATYEDSIERNSVDVQQILHTPPSKHKSLFSPETPTTREPHTQSARPKSKQKTPPVAATKIKERVSPFASSPPTPQDSLATKRPSSNDGPSSNKKLRTSNVGEGELSIKIKQDIKMEDTSSLEAMKMLGRVPDLIQPIRDNPLLPSNGKNSSASSIINDLKPPELIKPFESDRFYAMSQHKSLSINMHMLSNGMDLNVQIKQEPIEHRIKKELPEHYSKKESLGHKAPEISLSHVQPKVEYTSPMKSAQSISALLQEPLAPMPSLLQGLQHNQASLAQQVHQEQLQLQQSQQQSLHHPLMEHQLPVVTQCLSLPIASDNPMPIASTVDISALSCVPLTQQTNNSVVETASSVAMLTTVPPIEEKRSEHHKSEKKKKKEKHKHKDKEKSKDKHKHKHKDKDKERHREKKDKERHEEIPTAAPIKITIPKDKLNLSTESSPTVIGGGSITSDKNISPQSTVLKIKIPKERLKGADNVPGSSPVQPPVVQGPLKIKIRTDGISRSSTTPAPLSIPSSSSLASSANGSSGTAHYAPSSSESFANETASRKRVETIGDSSGGPLAKKQALMMPATGYGQGHRPGERQNGRHYNTGSSNKVRGRGGRQHHGGRGPPPHHATAASQRGSVGGHYQRDGYGNGRGGRNHHQAPYHPHQPHHPPAVRGDVGGYVRGPGRVDQAAESYFYAPNYPPSMFNTSAGYIYDPAYQQYYQQQFQQQSQGYSMYPAGNGLMITPDGAVNTSIPPPPSSSLLPNHPYPNRNMMPHQSVASVRQEDLQSLPQPPLAPPPSPPPLPNGPPPPPPPPPPSMPE